jgi:hypothetical protein
MNGAPIILRVIAFVVCLLPSLIAFQSESAGRAVIAFLLTVIALELALQMIGGAALFAFH